MRQRVWLGLDFGVRWQVKPILVCIVLILQSCFSVIVFSPSAHAEDMPLDPPIVDILPPNIPTGGTPHNTSKTTHVFNFDWLPSHDELNGPVRYELRASLDSTQTGAQETSNAWLSGLLDTPTMPFQTITGATNGQWYWQVRALDEAGNRSAWSQPWHVFVDTNGPNLTINEPLASLFGGPTTSQVPFSATMSDVGKIASYRVELDGVDVTAQTAAQGAIGDASITLTGVFETSVLSDGDHIFRLIASDALGNIGESSRLVAIDKTAPVLLTNIKESQVLRGIVSIEGTANDAHLLRFSLAIRDSNDKGVGIKTEAEEEVMNLDTASGTLHYDWDTTTVSDGTYVLRLSGHDSVGNEMTLIRTVTVSNVIESGLGTITVAGNDPLLDQLSKQLAEPFTPADNLLVTPFISQDVVAKVSDLANSTKPVIPDTDQNAKVPAVAPSEEGWRIFGVAWYWWLLVSIAAMFSWRRLRFFRTAYSEAL